VIVGREMSVAEVMDEIEQDVAFYDQSGGGVTFSGGEPLAQPAFLREILQACKTRALHTTLDTCGFARWDVLEEIRKSVDLFLYDLKLIDDARHHKVTGVSNASILENLRRLSRKGHRIILRVPVIPGINDDEGNIRAIAMLAADLPHLERIDLLSYHRIGRDKYRSLGRVCPMPEVDPPSDKRIAEIARRLRALGLDVNVA
jgi:pyruvate formate lyase activating enzyme